MSNKQDEPIARDGYDRLAEAFHRQADTKPHNAYLERPTTISLMPSVSGMKTLDAGCGPGWYSRWMADRGADVTAVDVSPNMIKHAKERLDGTGASVMVFDLDKPFPFRNDQFDLVLMPLVADNLKSLNNSFREVYRVLKENGYFILSFGNPSYEYFMHRRVDSYFEEKMVNVTWRGFGFPVDIPFFMRPLTAYTEALHQTGFVIERLVEAKPTEEFKRVNKDDYNRMMKYPGFICVRCRLAFVDR